MENFISIGLRYGVLVGFWITVSLLALTLLMALFAKLDSISNSDSNSYASYKRGFFDSVWSFPFVLFGIFAAIAGSFFVGSLAPFDSKYHHSYRVSGTVTEVSNVMSGSGGDLTRTPILTMEGVDRDIVMDDPRAVNLKGKDVDLTCTINWVYQGADEYKCIIYKVHGEELTAVN